MQYSRVIHYFPLIFACFLFACASTPQTKPQTELGSIEQRAFALYGVYVAMEARGADMVEDPSVSSETKDKIRLASSQGHSIMEGLYEAARLVRTARAETTTMGMDPAIRLNAANANLANWIKYSVPYVANMRDAVGGR